MIEALTKMDTYIQLYILLFRQKDFDVGIRNIFTQNQLVLSSAPPKSEVHTSEYTIGI